MVFNRSYAIVCALCIVFFVLTSYWSLQWPSPHYNSPDETATAVFISQFVNTGSFRIEEPLNMGLGIIHPRSTTTIGTAIVPGGFLGLPFLYGTIARVVGMWIIPFLTPFFASLAAFAFFYTLASFADGRIATWSTIALLAHPGWIYYASRGLYPDVLALAFVLFAAAAVCAWNNERHAQQKGLWMFLAALCFASSIAVRVTGVLWIVPLVLSGGWVLRRRLSWHDGFLFVFASSFVFVSLGALQKMTYGSPFATGYTPFGTIEESMNIGARVAPDGLVIWRILQNVLDYLVSMFWWYTIPIVLGIALAIRSVCHPRPRIKYGAGIDRGSTAWIPPAMAGGMTVASAMLILYYGNWDIRDSAVHGPTIGTSFARYWLPITVGALPFLGFAISEWARRRVVRAFVVLVLVGSVLVPILLPVEGLRATRDVTVAAAEIGAAIIARTEPNAIIVTEQADKILFPERRVIVNDPADRGNIEVSLTVLSERYAPVYYVTSLQGQDIDYINKRISEYGISWVRPEQFGTYWLYALKSIYES